MDGWLKQSTVFTDRIGPVLDASGVEYGGLVIGDLSRTKNGTTTTMAAASAITYDTNGYYSLTTIAGDSDTLGRLVITVNKSTYQMPPRSYMVIPATVYDVLVTNAWNAANGGGDVKLINSVSTSPVTTIAAVQGQDNKIVTDSTGRVNAFLIGILTSTFTETSLGLIAACFKQFFNIASPTSTANTITNVTTTATTTNLTNLPAVPTDWLTAAGVKTDAITKIQSGLSTYAGGDTAGTTTLLSRLTATPPTADAIAAKILRTPANLLLTTSDGYVTPTSSGGGTGSYTLTITVDDGTTVLQNATVTLTINSSRYYATTNASGVAVLTPNEGNGTYGVQLACAGYQFTPTTLTTSGNTTHTYSMTAVSITPSTGSGVTMYGYTTDSSGNVVEGSVTVQFQMSKLLSGDTGVIVNPTILTMTSNGSGLAQFVNCRVGATYRVRTSRNGNVSQWGSFVAVAGGGQIGSAIV